MPARATKTTPAAAAAPAADNNTAASESTFDLAAVAASVRRIDELPARGSGSGRGGAFAAAVAAALSSGKPFQTDTLPKSRAWSVRSAITRAAQRLGATAELRTVAEGDDLVSIAALITPAE